MLSSRRSRALTYGFVAAVFLMAVSSGLVFAATVGTLSLLGIQSPIFNVTFATDSDFDLEEETGFSEASGPEEGFFVFRLIEQFNSIGQYTIKVKSKNLSDGACTVNGNNKPCVVDDGGIISQLSYDFLFDTSVVNDFVDGEATVSSAGGGETFGSRLRKGQRVREVLLRLDGDAGILASPDFSDTLTFTVAGP